MSRLSKIFRKVAPIASFIPGPIGAIAKVGAGIYAAKSAADIFSPAAPSQPSYMASMLPSLGRVIPGVGRSLPALGRAAGGMAVRGAKSVYNAAASYCRKHPAWCQTIGGIAAVEAMIGRGELPLPKRRRGRGITATELKHFKRVARFTSKYCAPVRKAMSSRALRGKSCR